MQLDVVVISFVILSVMTYFGGRSKPVVTIKYLDPPLISNYISDDIINEIAKAYAIPPDKLK